MTESGFEIHVTVACAPAHTEAFRALAERLACRCLWIELSRGRTVHQPMLTRRVVGTLAAARSAAAHVALALAVRRAGVRVLRVKIETAADAACVPLAAVARGAGYFEHHVRIRVPDHADLGRPGTVVEPHGAHLSRNARTTSSAGSHERFVTQRCHGVGRADAAANLTGLLAALACADIVVVGSESEFVVHDGRLALDDGWLGAPPPLAMSRALDQDAAVGGR